MLKNLIKITLMFIVLTICSLKVNAQDSKTGTWGIVTVVLCPAIAYTDGAGIPNSKRVPMGWGSVSFNTMKQRPGLAMILIKTS
jgi:hypothetical protein